MVVNGLNIPDHLVADLCRQSEVAELWLVGSFARGEATAKSDVDFVLKYRPDVSFEARLQRRAMRLKLARMFHRPVSLLPPQLLDNPIFAEEFDETAVLVYKDDRTNTAI